MTQDQSLNKISENELLVQFGWFLNPSWQTRHCNPDTLDLHGHCPLVLLQTKLVDPVPSQLQAIKGKKKLKFCYFFCRGIIITVIFTVRKSKMKVQAFITFQSANATLAVALTIGITSIGWVGHWSIRIAITIIENSRQSSCKQEKGSEDY